MSMFLRSIYCLILIILLCKYKKVIEVNFFCFYIYIYWVIDFYCIKFCFGYLGCYLFL